MRHFAIGDLQGCYDPLCRLLEQVAFDPTSDRLWIAGDLVNRGPASLDCLRFLYRLGDRCEIVLGNHDLHLLAIAYGGHRIKRKDTLQPVLDAPDAEELLTWLRTRKLLHRNDHLGYTLVHAGIPPQWTLDQAEGFAREVETVLCGPDFRDYFAAMYGNQPDCWDDQLSGMDRWRCITNYFTRMRFCTADGVLDFSTKTGVEDCPEGMAPWFAHPHRLQPGQQLLFGHWAALEGRADAPHVTALDTGCVWGRCLTALELESGQLYAAPCQPD